MSFSSSLSHNLTLHPGILQQLKELGIEKNAKGIIAFAIVSQFAVVELEDLSPFNDGERFQRHCGCKRVGKGVGSPYILS